MRIAFVTSEYVTPGRVDGGLANYLKKTGEELARRGCDIWIFTPAERDDTRKDGALTVREVRRHSRLLDAGARLPLLGRLAPVARQLVVSRRLARRLREAHRQGAFDIIQASNYKAPGYFLRNRRPAPMVCRVSSYTPLYRSAYGATRNLDETLSDWLELSQVLHADAVFAPSRLMADVYARLEGCAAQVIRTPVDLSEVTLDPSFYREHLEGLSYLLYFGTLSRTKGVDLLADAIPAVLGRHPALSIVFVGRDDGLPGGQRLADHVRARCADYVSRLLFFPALPKTQLYPVIARSVGVVMPSRVDNYPNACLEAQALGVPVVGTYGSSLEEMIAEGETGFLAANNDPLSLEQAMERLLLLTPDEREMMKERLEAHIQAIRAEDRVGQLQGFYESVIARSRAKPAASRSDTESSDTG